MRQLKKADGSAADPSLARQVLPAGNLTAAGVLGSAQSVQFFGKSELSAITGITNVLNVFPYGYVIAVFMGNGDGTVQTGTNYNSSGVPQQQVVLGDINGDGNLDVISSNGNATTSGISVYLGNGTGTLQAPSVFSMGQATRGVAVGDLNGDGKLDAGGTTLTGTSMHIILKN